MMLRLFCFLSVLSSVLSSQETLAGAAQRNVMVSLPVLVVAREGVTKVEANLMGKGTLALEWSVMVPSEDLRKSELKRAPGKSLLSYGQEIGLMFNRFSRPQTMSGFGFGLGVGLRKMAALYKRPGDDSGMATSAVAIGGTTYTGRIGYRYVGDEWGFTAGIYLGMRYFQNSPRDARNSKLTDLTPISVRDKAFLKKRYTTRLQPGIEIGWAF